jgi:AcrR family transcriptional regulator
MRNMAEPTVDSDAGNHGRAWRQNSTRVAILEAARRLAARGGVEAVTLSRVAAEAGFAPPAVYAFFTSKDELHLAVVAEDLDRLARAMRGEEPDETPGTGQGEDVPPPEYPVAEIIAFQPPGPVEDTSEIGMGSEPMAEGVDTDESVDAAAPAEGETAHEAAVLASGPGAVERTAGSDDQADVSASDVEPVPQLATATGLISLAEIEQAMGVVLAGGEEDFAEAPADEEMVPDAFPEEHVAPSAAEFSFSPDIAPESAADAQPAEEKPFVERRMQPDRRSGNGGFRARWRRARGEAEAAQAPLPLDTPAQPASPSSEQAIAQLQEAIARLEARPVDSWLERRLRVFERTLADIEARMEKAERDSSMALTTVSESFKALEERLSASLDGAARQVTDSEQRHRAIAADLRLYVKDLSGRLAAVETSLSRFLSADDGEFVPAPPARAEVEEMRPREPAPVKLTPLAEPRAMHEPQGENYLSAARRAANSAAAEATRSRGMGPLSYLKLSPAAGRGVSVSRRALQVVAGVMTLIVLLITAMIWLRGGPGGGPVRLPVAAETMPAAVQSADARVAALARAGDARAELLVGLKLLNGDGVATDVPSAAYWLKKAAAQHEPVAEYWLGTLYERGHGVSKDAAKAMQAYEAAGEAGNAKAMYRLGVGYAEGWDGEANYADAANWFAKAAKLGVIDAQFNLGVLYERGSGVPNKPLEAFKWYAIAAAQGDAESKARIDALAARLAPSKVMEAQAAAAKFHPQEPNPGANVEPSVQSVAGTH